MAGASSGRPLAIGAWIVALIVLLAIVPAVWQGLDVNPNQLTKETPYIANNITATRSAYDLTAISETPYSLQGDLSAAELQANDVTISNVRLWDPEVLLAERQPAPGAAALLLVYERERRSLSGEQRLHPDHARPAGAAAFPACRLRRRPG